MCDVFVHISVEVENRIKELSSDHRNFETGGVLIGYYSDDHTTAIVTEVTPPPRDSEHGFDTFVRGVDGLSDIFVDRWNSVPRTFYLGEWHSHPKAVGPSFRDILQMKECVSERCKVPIMVLHRPDKIQCFVFRDSRLVEIERKSDD